MSVIDDDRAASSIREDVERIGDGPGEFSSAASTCAAKPLIVESNDFMEPSVLRRSRYLFTSMRLLKYASRQSSKVKLP